MLVPVGRHRLAATVWGHGGPAVVVETGYGGGAGLWHDVAEELADETTVVTYDRAPYGASSPAVDRRRPADAARDLSGLLTALAVSGPFVLVGHSSGGRVVRRFAAEHPEQVAGMVLVDSSHEDQQRRLRSVLPFRMRFEEALEAPRLWLGRHSDLGFAARRSQAREFRALARQTAADIALQPGALGDKPLVVLTRAELPDGMWPAWYELQQELAAVSHNSRHTTAATPNHFIHVEEPDLVTRTIRTVLHAARTGEPLE